MAKLKFDKESVQGFFFNHAEKIVLAVVLLLFGLFIWSGSSLEGIGAQSPTTLVTQVDAAVSNVDKDSWENIKKEHPVRLDHIVIKGDGDAVIAESYYRLETPWSPPSASPNTPRLDPEIFTVTDVEATVVLGALAFKTRTGWTDPFADLANMEQKKIEAPKKKTKKKKKNPGAEMYPGMENMMTGDSGAEYPGATTDGPGAMPSGYMSSMSGAGGEMGMSGTAAVGPTVRADANKFHGYQPTAVAMPTGGPSVIGRPYPIVAVKALVPYQQQWDEFERVFADAVGYQPARDIPRYLAFVAEKAEVPSDPNTPLKWEVVTHTNHALEQIPVLAYAGYPGEIADPKYLLPGILTMPVPPVMMRDLRGLALHSKVPMQKVAEAKTVKQAGPELADVEEPSGVADVDEIPTGPGSARPGMGPGGSGMYGAAGSGMYGSAPSMGAPDGASTYGSGEGGIMSGEYGGGMGGMSSMGGMSVQAVRGPQAEFLMVRFFDLFIKPGKKYVYRIQVVLEDPNHPQIAQMQPTDRTLADTVRTRLANVAADEAKKTAELKKPVRHSMLRSEWSEPTAPVSVSLTSETYAGGVVLPRMLDIQHSTDPTVSPKSGYSIPAEGEPTATVMNLSWNLKYAIDVPGIVKASRGAYLNKSIATDVIDPISLGFKSIPDYPLASGELVVDLRGGEILEAPADGVEPLLAPGEIAVIDASGHFIVRNELDDWQVFDRYAPPPPIVVDSISPTVDPSAEGVPDAAEMEKLYGE